MQNKTTRRGLVTLLGAVLLTGTMLSARAADETTTYECRNCKQTITKKGPGTPFSQDGGPCSKSMFGHSWKKQ